MPAGADFAAMTSGCTSCIRVGMVKETDGTLQPAIVVTGASSGIGRDIARVAARDRCFLLLLGRSQQALDQLVAELAAAGAQAAALSIDLLDPRAPDRIESALSERSLYCDVLVNSAGFGVFGPASRSRAQGAIEPCRCQHSRADRTDAAISSRNGGERTRRRSQRGVDHRLRRRTQHGGLLRIEGVCELVLGRARRRSRRQRSDRHLPYPRCGAGRHSSSGARSGRAVS